MDNRKPINFPIRSGLIQGRTMSTAFQTFDANAIQEAIDHQLARVPAGHHNAFIAHYTSGGDLQLSAFGRLNEHLSYSGTFTHRPNMPPDGLAELVVSF